MDIRQMLLEIGLSDPYRDFDPQGRALDLQGWASEHHYFPTLISMVKPRQIIEVGTWKGASAVNMAQHALPLDPDVTILCIDTWLGSNEGLWRNPANRPLLALEHGLPTVYRQFLTNIIREQLTETIFPLPMTSIAAAGLLSAFEVRADLIYIDAGHGEYEVYGDLIHYWPLVRAGGILFGDDYWSTWSGVIRAVNRFAHEQQLPLETNAGKWFVTKPGP
jgi:hypothetical protein